MFLAGWGDATPPVCCVVEWVAGLLIVKEMGSPPVPMSRLERATAFGLLLLLLLLLPPATGLARI